VPTIPDLLDELLRGEAAKARIALARDLLEQQLHAIHETTGTAPTLRLPGLGTVSLALPKPHPEIVDADAFASWVAERHPSEVTTTVEIRGVTADELPEVLEAVRFAVMQVCLGHTTGDRTEVDQMVTGRVTVREAFRNTLLDLALGDRDKIGEPLFTPDTVELIDGVQVVDGGGSPTMTVRLDKDAKARAILTGRAAAENDLTALDTPPDAGMPAASPDDVDADSEPDRDDPHLAVEHPCGCAHAQDAHGGAKHRGGCRALVDGGGCPCPRYSKARTHADAERVLARTPTGA
jgi:hypothetical protein